MMPNSPTFHTTVSKAIRSFLLQDRADQTRKTYENFLRRFARDIGVERPLCLIRREDIDAYIYAMRHRTTKYVDHPSRPIEYEPLASATIYKNIKMIKAFFRWCVENNLIGESPADHVVNSKPGHPLGIGKAATDAEVEALLAASRFMPREYAMIRVLAQSGCRAGELAKLRIRDLVLDERRALVDGKGNFRRWIYLDNSAVTALRAWLSERPKANHGYVFVAAYKPLPLTSSAVSQVVRRLSKKARLERTLGPHSMRHRVGLKFARARIPPRVAQHYLGHRDIKITLTYYQGIEESDLLDAGEVLSL